MARRPTIFLRCDECGNAVIAPRSDYDPDEASCLVTNECNICNAANGGFEETWYFDAHGNEIRYEETEVYRRTD